MTTLNEKIKILEVEIERLKSKVNDLSSNVEEKETQPYSKVGGGKDRSDIRPVDTSAGLGQVSGGNIPWHDKELVIPPWGIRPDTPTKAFNKHGHSKFAGGALDINTLELVEYDVDWETDVYNKHSQGFWQNIPTIKKAQNKDGDMIDMIGNMDIEFDADSGKWVASAKDIDVEKTNLVMKVDGDIKLDGNGNEMKAPLYNDDPNKSNVLWDEDNRVFRFFAVYSD